MIMRGFFVCIEGLDKSGKTTQSVLLVESLCRKGLDAVYTTEPSSGEVGRLIKTHVLRRKQRVSAVVEALLFAADRVEHIENEINPLLKERKIIISDRYVFSSLAYQGTTGLDANWIAEINRHAPAPDLAIYLDVPVQVASQRGKGEKSVMETPEIQKEVRDAYMKLVREGKMILINGNRSKHEVAAEIQKLVLKKLGY